MQALLQTLPHLKTAKAGVCQSDGARPGCRTQSAVDCVVLLPVADLARAGRVGSISQLCHHGLFGIWVLQDGASYGGEC